MKQSTPRSIVALIIIISALAVFVRLVVWSVFYDLPASTDWINFYNPAAVSVAESGRSDLSDNALDVSPVYVVFLAITYRIFGFGVTTMRGVQIFLDGLVVLGIFAIGDRVFNRRVGILAGIVYALYPPSIYIAGLGQPEMLLTLCLIGMVLVWLWASERNSPLAYTLVGCLLGVALLIKPNYLGFLPFWFVTDMLLMRGGRRRALANLAFACVGVLALVLPWSIFRSITNNPTSSFFIYARIVYMGSISRPTLSNGALMPLGEFYSKGFEAAQGLLDTNSPSAVMILQLGIKNWLALVWPNPFDLLVFLVNKFWQSWYATDRGSIDKFLRWFQLPIIILWISGTVSVLSDRNMCGKQRPLLLITGYTILALFLITPLFREVLPIMPIVLLFAAYGAVRLARLVHQRLYSRVIKEMSL